MLHIPEKPLVLVNQLERDWTCLRHRKEEKEKAALDFLFLIFWIFTAFRVLYFCSRGDVLVYIIVLWIVQFFNVLCFLMPG